MGSNAVRQIRNATSALAKTVQERLQTLRPKKELASKTYRFLAQQLAKDVAGVAGTPKIVFSSTGSLELSSEILLMLAYFLQDEFRCRILLIDGTFRRGGISNRLGLANPIGFLDYLCSEERQPKTPIVSTGNKNVFVMPSGSTPSLGKQVADRDLIVSRLNTAAQGFSYVIVQQDRILNDSRYLVFNEIADLVLLHAVEQKTRQNELEICQKIYEDHSIRGVRLVLSE